MAAKFGFHASDFTTSTGALTAFRIAPAAQKFVEIIEMTCTGSGITAAADTQHEFGLFPLTTGGAGTLTGITPEKFQQTSAASGATVGVKATAEPTTYGAVSLVFFGFNQRGGMRWAVPKGEGVLFNSGDTNAVAGAKIISAAAGKISYSANFWENV